MLLLLLFFALLHYHHHHRRGRRRCWWNNVCCVYLHATAESQTSSIQMHDGDVPYTMAWKFARKHCALICLFESKHCRWSLKEKKSILNFSSTNHVYWLHNGFVIASIVASLLVALIIYDGIHLMAMNMCTFLMSIAPIKTDQSLSLKSFLNI